MGIAELLAKAVIRELKGYQGTLDYQDSKGQADIRELADRVVTLAFTATQVTREFLETLVTRVTRDIVVSLALQDNQVTQEFLDSVEFQVTLDTQAWKETQVIQEMLDPQVTRVKMAFQVIQALKDYLDIQEIRGIVDSLDKKD